MAIATWPEPWRDIIDPEEAAGLVRQLQREAAVAHILQGAELFAVARRDDTDDVLFAFADGRIVQVHLTWQARPGEGYPASRIFANADVWRDQSTGG